VTDGLLAGADDSVDAGRRLGSAERTERSLAPLEVLLSIAAIVATCPLVQHTSSCGTRPSVVLHLLTW
jgi:hypothetical protein